MTILPAEQTLRVSDAYASSTEQQRSGATRPSPRRLSQDSKARPLQVQFRWPGSGHDQVLFQLSVGHLVGGHLQLAVGKGHGEDAEHHAAAGFLFGLFEAERRAQGLQAGGKVLQGLLVEVGVAVVGEQAAVDVPVREPIEDGQRLRLLLGRRGRRSPRTMGVIRRAIRLAAWVAISLVSTMMAARSSGNTMFSETKPETSPECSMMLWPSRLPTSTPRP